MNKPINKMTKKDLLNLFEEIENKYNQLIDKTSEVEKKNQEIENLFSEIRKQKIDSNYLISEINKRKQEFEKLYSEISNQKETSDEFFSEINKRKQEFEKLYSEKQETLKNLEENIIQKNKKLEELIKKTESLLPGATAVGLASSYIQGKKEKTTLLYWLGFILSLGGLFVMYFKVLFNNLDNLTLMNLLNRTILGLPLVWIAWYCQKSISQTTRLKEEYQHKERLMRAFVGFSKEVDKLTEINTDENISLKRDLISVTIKAIQRNPADTLGSPKTLREPWKSVVPSKKRMKRVNN